MGFGYLVLTRVAIATLIAIARSWGWNWGWSWLLILFTFCFYLIGGSCEASVGGCCKELSALYILQLQFNSLWFNPARDRNSAPPHDTRPGFTDSLKQNKIAAWKTPINQVSFEQIDKAAFFFFYPFFHLKNDGSCCDGKLNIIRGRSPLVHITRWNSSRRRRAGVALWGWRAACAAHFTWRLRAFVSINTHLFLSLRLRAASTRAALLLSH